VPLVRVGFDVAGETQISRALQMTALEAADMSEPLDEMADVILAAVRHQFGTEGRSSGEPWPALNKRYEAWKLATFGPHPILVRQGGSKGQALNKRQAVTITRTRMVYEPKGRAQRILSWHQRGAGHLPVRKVVNLTAAQKRAAVDRVFSAWLNRLRRGTS